MVEAANFVEAEAGSVKGVLLSFWPFLSSVENLNVLQLLVKYMEKKLLFNKPAFAKKSF